MGFYYQKIKETFTFKLKIIFVDYYFHPFKHRKNAESIFQKTFYAETNEALIEKEKRKLTNLI